MGSYPEVISTQHVWKDEVVGGSYGHPVIMKLYETELISNGSFEDELVGWDFVNTGLRVDMGDEAMDGNYALKISQIATAHTYFSRTSPDNNRVMNAILFSGFVKNRYSQDGDIDNVYIKVYCSAVTTRSASPTNYIILRIKLDDSSISYKTIDDSDETIVGISQWIKFYLMADITELTGAYVHFEFYANQSVGGNYDNYLDDLKVYEVKEITELECPNSLRLKWERKTDANYEMVDGTDKDYVRGWRPIYSLNYEYCSRAQMINSIGITESDYNFFVPQKDNLNGDFVRMIEDFSGNYFNDKFLGHTNELVLRGVYLRKFKNIEYGGEYFEMISQVPSASSSESSSPSA